MEKWVALRTIFEVCTKEKEYKGGGGRHDPWWRKAAAKKHHISMLEDISEAEMERR